MDGLLSMGLTPSSFSINWFSSLLLFSFQNIEFIAFMKRSYALNATQKSPACCTIVVEKPGPNLSNFVKEEKFKT